MKKEFVIDLKDANNDRDVFDAFNIAFRDVFKHYSWRIHIWDALHDFLWGLIQGPEVDGLDSDFYRDVDEIYIKVINSHHLATVHADFVKSKNESVLEALQESFAHIMREQAKRTTPEDLPIFRNSKLEIVS